MLKQTRQMICEEIKSAMEHIEESIKNLIKSQNVFKSQKICNQLLLASSTKIRELKLKKGRDVEDLESKDKMKIYKLLQDLEYLKEQSKEFSQIIKILKTNEAKITATLLLESMFKIVYSCMFMEKYGYSFDKE